MTPQTNPSVPSAEQPRNGPSSAKYTLLIPLLVGTTIATLLAPLVIDGPLNSIVPGGPLQSGELVDPARVDWTTMLGDDCSDGHCVRREPVELQLLDPARSRYTGAMLYAGDLYIPCDLGYMWSRFEGAQRWLLRTIYWFKSWHEDAANDGRAVLRIDGKRYPKEAVRVTDPATIAALKTQLEEAAAAWVAPEGLGDAPTEPPNDIWFFRLHPR